jgi:hypothetical protein
MAQIGQGPGLTGIDVERENDGGGGSVVDGDDVLVVLEMFGGMDGVGKTPVRRRAWSAMSCASWFDNEWRTEELPME